MTATPTSPAAAGFAELAKIGEAESNLASRLDVLHAELREVGWRGRPATEAIPGVANGDRGVPAYGQVGELLHAVRAEQRVAAREGRTPDVTAIEAELEQLEIRSEMIRSEIRELGLERRSLPAERDGVVRRRYSEFAAHARQVAADSAAHADQFVAMAREILDARAAVYEAIALTQSGRPLAISDARWAAMSSHLVGSLMPWTDANQPALVALWRAIETVAGAGTFATGEPTELEAA